jgi:hypothetical protein
MALLFAVVFGLIAFVPMIGMSVDISALTSGGLQSVAGLLPTFWMLLVGAVVVSTVIVVVKLIVD